MESKEYERHSETIIIPPAMLPYAVTIIVNSRNKHNIRLPIWEQQRVAPVHLTKQVTFPD
jgi:N-glycosylase/DNA lyase